MPRKNRLILRVFSLWLAGAFLLQQAPVAQGLEAVSSVPAGRSISQNPALFEPPLKFVSMKELHSGPKDGLLILIEDAHSNYSGQQNLAGALDDIMDKYGVSLVLSEGGTDDCSLTPLKKVATPEVWKRVAKT